MTKKMSEKTPLISALERICAEYPRDEKVFIVPQRQIGYQILEGLARAGSPWLNFHVATALSLASDYAETSIIKDGLEVLSGSGIITLIDTIFTGLADGGRLKYFKRRTVNKGLISALAGMVTELRTMGTPADKIDEKVFVSVDKARDIKLILSEYEKALKEKKFIDQAGLLGLAVESLESQKSKDGRKFVILSRCYMRGLERRFIEALAGDKLIVVGEGKVAGLSPPSDLWPVSEIGSPSECRTNIERLRWLFESRNAPKKFEDDTVQMFAAVGVRNEVKEIFRRIEAAGLPADDVEVVCTDSETYGREIYSLCEKLGLKATFSDGTMWYLRSPGRALAGFLMWMQDDFTERYLRRLLASGDVRVPADKDADVPGGAALAHLLKTSGVGWGRERYSIVLEKKTAEFEERVLVARENGEEDKAGFYEKSARNLGFLKDLCEQMLGFIPIIGSDGEIDFKMLCDGCVQFLQDYTRPRDSLDNAFVMEVERCLKLLGEISSGPVPFDEAVENLLNIITGIKVGASGPEPGCIYVSHYKHGGRSGRNNTFLLGLDESRFPGQGLQDPVLLDDERKKISSDLELSEDKIRRNLYDMAGLLSGLKGKVTMSYASYDVREEKNVFPSSILLQIMRVKEGRPKADYEDLLNLLGDHVTYSAGDVVGPDETDWWLSRLAKTEVLKDGTKTVTELYPGLREGLTAAEARESDLLTEYDGRIFSDTNVLDPRKNAKKILSSTVLEDAAKCPFSYFLKHVLEVRKPEEVERDVDAWLDPMQRGSLLHEVFQNFAEEMKGKKFDYTGQKKLVLKILEETVRKYKEKVPPPSDIVFDNERKQMMRDTEVFLNINRQLNTEPVHLEMAFGRKSKPAVEIPLGSGGSFYLSGKIDRIDRAGEHEYHVWDYKTGSASPFEEDDYMCGGEQLQHSLYAVAAETVLRKSGEDPDARVTQSGYLLPTEKGTKAGKGGVFKRDPSRKEEWQGAVNSLLDLIAGGTFYMSDKVRCDYCDYFEVCGDDRRRKQSKVKIKNEDNKALDAWRVLKKYE